MSSLNSKDRVSLCLFTYADGRRCRLPRASKSSSRISTGAPHAGAPPSFSEGGSSHFCHYHAKKESRAATADNLAKDLAAFFSGHTVSANDLTTALARLLPAVVRGDIKPRAARTIAYMAQTLLQSIHLSQSEFKDAFGSDALRKSIRTGITSNHNRLFPPESQPDPAPPHAQPTQNDCRGGACPALAPEAPSPRSTSVQPKADSVGHPACPEEGRREDTEGSLSAPAAPLPQPTAPPPTNPRQRPASPHRDPYAIHFDDHNYRLREPEKAY